MLSAGPGLTDAFGGWAVDGQFGYAWERLTVLQSDPADWYLVGSSRMGMVIDVDTFAGEMGIARDRVEKLTLNAGTPWEVWQLVKLRPAAFAGARGIVLDVGAWQFNARGSTRFAERFPRLATWSDRVKLADENGEERADIVDLVWPYRSQRRSIMDWLSAFWHLANPKAQTSTHDQEWDDHEARVARQGMPVNATPDAAYQRHLADFAWLPLMEGALCDLANWCQEQKVQLVLIRPPTSASYHQQIIDNEVTRRGYEQMIELLDEIADRTGALVIVDTTADSLQLGADDEVFVDYGHMSRRGGQTYTRSLVTRMQTALPR
jgi:hypothetical protein